VSDAIRILLLADSHLGFDLPTRPRVERRRRGHDFLANYAAALRPALTGEVDIVVHAGDVFDRPSVGPAVAYQALEPLRRVADGGIPVFIVPGNHERSSLPHARFASHPLVHVFDRPRTLVAEVRGTRIALAGFPYERRDVRARFPTLLEQSGWSRERVELRVLYMHHCAEGATVGPRDYTFTTASDVIRLRDVPREFSAVLSGHIHRQQVLVADLNDQPLETPVLYPGSIERTSFAELGEPKGFMVVHLSRSEGRARWEFRQLPARPMILEEIAADGIDPIALDSAVRAIVAAAPPDAVLSIRIRGRLSDAHWSRISAAQLRTFVPATMNVGIVPTDRLDPRQRDARHSRDVQPDLAVGA
jgi:exonuclease SbcD